jgi:putative DNA primase/helicase
MLLSEVYQEKIRWLWHGYIPLGKVTVIDGDPGLGKSLITLDLAARVTKGREMPDGTPGAPGGVVLASGEDGLSDTVRPRLEAAGAELSRIVDITFTDTEKGQLLKIPDDLATIEHAIFRVGAVLVVIDPVYAFLRTGLNPDKDTDVRQALTPLAKLAERLGVSIVLIRHLNKAEEKKAVYRGSGSIGLIGLARSGLLVANSRIQDGNVLVSVKCNLTAKPRGLLYRVKNVTDDVPVIEWLGESPETADELTAPVASVRHAYRKLNAAELIKEQLALGPLPSVVLDQQLRDAGISEKTYRRARQEVGVESYQTREGWVSALPTQMVRRSDGQPSGQDGEHIIGGLA